MNTADKTTEDSLPAAHQDQNVEASITPGGVLHNHDEGSAATGGGDGSAADSCSEEEESGDENEGGGEKDEFDDMPALEGETPASTSFDQQQYSSEQKSTKTKNKKPRKPRDPNKRRKIRKLLRMEDLSHETLQAVEEEEKRRRVLMDQAKHARLQQQQKQQQQEQQQNIMNIKPERVDGAEIYTNNNNMMAATSQQDGTNVEGSGGEVKTSTTTSSYFTAPCLTSLLTATDTMRNKSSANKQKSTASGKSTGESSSVICISSDEDDDKPETINISSDSSDEVILCPPENKDHQDVMFDDDMNNSGLHVNDERNIPDETGRVLINVNHPPEEADIFLAPQIARIIRPHQIGGIRFMYDNIILTRQQYATSDGLGCILAHSMGLGKTLQVIGFIEVFLHHTAAKTALCVVPVNTLMNWVAEFDKWLPPASKLTESPLEGVEPRNFNVHVLRDIHKTIDARAKVVSTWQSEGGVLLLGYEMFRLLTTSRQARPRRSRKKPKKDPPNSSVPIDVEEEDRKSNLHKSVISMLLNPGPDMIICDEGHRIKNNGARTSERLKEIRTKRRVVLTGYPMQNNLVEYWCMVDFVRPDYLGSKREFYNLFERPITNGQGSDSTKEDRRLMRCRSDVLHNLLKGFVQRRSHSVLCHTLPEKKEYVLMVRFSDIQKKLYNTYMRLRSSGSGEESTSWTSCINPIRAFSVCCRIWNHPDVLYQTYMEQVDIQSDLDIDLDYTILDSNGKAKALSIGKDDSRKHLRKRKINNPSQDLAVASDDENVTMSPRSTSSDDKEKGENYEWVSNMLDGYQMGSLEQSGKMVILLHLIEQSISIGDKILVFSQSLSTLSLIEEFLSRTKVPANPSSDPSQPLKSWVKGRSYLRLDGNTGSSEREKLINQFNNPNNMEAWLFLLSTKAGCLGINLIGANRVVVVDASWNPCYDAQAVCRCYRYGQQKKSFIYRLVADQSMEKKIYERQVSKQGMSDRVVDKLNPTQVFTKREVVSLLEFSDKTLPQIEYEKLVENVEDPVLKSLCKNHGNWLTKKPFTHESLLLDCKDQRLTKAERREALKNYEQDKRASLTLNYTRPSYISYYSTGSRSQSSQQAVNQIKLPTSRTSYNSRDQKVTSRPVASVQPYTTNSNHGNYHQSNVPRHLRSTIPTRGYIPTLPLPSPNQSMAQQDRVPSNTSSNIAGTSSSGGNHQQPNQTPAASSGVMCHMVVATTDIPIPTANTLTMSSNGSISSSGGCKTSSGRDRDRIRAGEEIMIMTTKKGTYIRTSENKIFTVKLNDMSSTTTSSGTNFTGVSWSNAPPLASTTSSNRPIGMMVNGATNNHTQQPTGNHMVTQQQSGSHMVNQQPSGNQLPQMQGPSGNQLPQMQAPSYPPQNNNLQGFNQQQNNNNLDNNNQTINNMTPQQQQNPSGMYEDPNNKQQQQMNYNTSMNNYYNPQQQQQQSVVYSNTTNNWMDNNTQQQQNMMPPPPPPPLNNQQPLMTSHSNQMTYNNNNATDVYANNNIMNNNNNNQMLQQQQNYCQQQPMQQQYQYQQQQSNNSNGMFQQQQQMTNGMPQQYQQQNSNYFQQQQKPQQQYENPQQQQMFNNQNQQQAGMSYNNPTQQSQSPHLSSFTAKQQMQFRQLCQQQQRVFDSFQQQQHHSAASANNEG